MSDDSIQALCSAPLDPGHQGKGNAYWQCDISKDWQLPPLKLKRYEILSFYHAVIKTLLWFSNKLALA